ncbi:MAG: transposase [Paracoccaceae bacterium]
MTDDTTIIPFRQPGSIIDPLTEIARDGARRMLMAALKAEADGFVAQFSEDRLADGRQRVVRHGTGPERVIQTGIGPIDVRRQKVRDRATDVPAETKVRFTSNILPKWARRSKSLDALLPALYLRGISTGDFQEALSAILGADAPNLSPGAIARLTTGWQEEHLHAPNPVESVFATVRHRTVRTKGALSQKTVKLMVFTLVQAASKTWRRLNGANQLPRVIEGVKFTDGVANSNPAKISAA